jgi:hypothetical protein
VQAVLLVDAANVVGSRPDGWWKDRAGAARRLTERIRVAVSGGVLDGPVVVVLEGNARAGADEGVAAGVTVLHAEGHGDDTIVDVAATSAEPVVLVSADRALAERCRATGADVVGPRWLLERLGP